MPWVGPLKLSSSLRTLAVVVDLVLVLGWDGLFCFCRPLGFVVTGGSSLLNVDVMITGGGGIGGGNVFITAVVLGFGQISAGPSGLVVTADMSRSGSELGGSSFCGDTYVPLLISIMLLIDIKASLIILLK